MKVGIITFHASHNYGSMLQAYALQQTVLGLGHQCEIINLRTKAQKTFYRPFFLRKGWIKKLKAIRYPRLAIDDVKKYLKFEDFLKTKYILSSQTYATAENLKRAKLDYDCYISGSDQIWNTCCFDFQTSYFLDFVNQGRRIAYAPSMGPMPFKHIDKKSHSFIKKSVSKYDAISVREEATAVLLNQVTGINAPSVVDPTLLINKQGWLTLAGNKSLINGDYIFVYTPWYNDYKQLFITASEIARQHKLKIICSTPDDVSRWHNNPLFEYHTAVGPIEFLNLVKYSKYMFCGSFHAVVFSIIFGKPFFAFDGMKDSRISSLLKIVGLEQCAEIHDDRMFVYDDEAVRRMLNPYINQSMQFLKDAIDGHFSKNISHSTCL